MVFHQFGGFVQPVFRLADACLQRAAIGEQGEGQTVTMIGVVDHLACHDFPGVATGFRVAVDVPQVGQAVPGVVQITWVSEAAEGLGVIEDEAAGGDERARVTVKNIAVVQVAVEKATGGVDRTRIVERQDAAGMIQQKTAAKKVD